MNLLAIDCEFNQPSGKIIQIGAVAFSTTGKILDTFSVVINPEEPISEFITNLTGIDNDISSKGCDISLAYILLAEFAQKNKTSKMTIAWGNGDLKSIKDQSLIDNNTNFQNRIIDTKTIYQSLATMLNAEMRAKVGLVQAMSNLNMSWDYTYGKPHDALADAHNTALFYLRLASFLRNGYKSHKDVL